MTDKKLLELAAKGAGIELSYGKVPYTSFDGLAKGWKDWNPLSDDGDALRLAVKLGIEITLADTDYVGANDQFEYCKNEDHYAAIRRAIVRAAAKIGRNYE